MDLSWSLYKEIIEIRYDTAFPLWDKAGLLTQEIVAELPFLKLTNAQPAEISLSSAEHGLSVFLGLNQSRVLATKAKSVSKASYISSFIQCSNVVTEKVISHLNIPTLHRVGNRIIFHATLNNESEVSPSLTALFKKINVESTLFSSLTDPRVEGLNLKQIVQRYENLGSAYQIQIKSFTEFIETQGEVTKDLPKSPTTHGLLFDVDIAIQSPFPSTKYLNEEWISSNLKLAEQRFITQL